ncbi:hypothetical protein [Bacillus sp. AK031]
MENPKEKFTDLFKQYSAIDISDPEWLKMQRAQGEFWSNVQRGRRTFRKMRKMDRRQVIEEVIIELLSGWKTKTMNQTTGTHPLSPSSFRSAALPLAGVHFLKSIFSISLKTPLEINTVTKLIYE